jgi:hypothetical protein
VCAQQTTDSTQSLVHLGPGFVKTGYSYGLTPFTYDYSGATGYFTGEFQTQVNVKNVPLAVSGYYTSLKNVTGLNNYLRVSFDAEAYKQRMKSKVIPDPQKIKDSLNQSLDVQQKLQQRIAYLEYLQSLSPEQYQHQLELAEKQQAIQDSIESAKQSAIDSASGIIPTQSSIPEFSLPTIDLPSAENYKNQLGGYIERYRQQSDSIKNSAQLYQQKINTIDSLRQLTPQMPTGAGTPFFNSVQSLQVGLCYPMWSPLMLSGISIRGVNLEFERGGYYFGFAAGKTISNLMFSPSVIQNNLNNVRNLYNFFDFNNVESGRSIAAMRVGRGTKNGDHIFVGLLYGKGLDSYWQDSLTPQVSGEQERNWVAEVDAQYQIAANHSLQFNYAKSIVKAINADPEVSQTSQTKWLSAAYRSHAAQMKYKGVFPKLKSNVTASLRWVDPFFRSFGAGFIRQDHIRYEIKTEHQLGKKIRLGLNVKRDANNLLRLYDQFTVLQSAGVSLAWKITSRLNIKASYNPVFQQVKEDGQVIYSNDNHIANGVVSWRPQTGKWKTMITGLHSYLKLYDGVINRIYSTTLVQASTMSKNGFTVRSTGTWYSVTPQDSVLTNSVIAGMEIGQTFKNKLMISAGVRYLLNDKFGNQPGFSVAADVPLMKQFSLHLEGQRLIPGDFYNSYGLEQFNSFPYLFTAQLTYNW